MTSLTVAAKFILAKPNESSALQSLRARLAEAKGAFWRHTETAGAAETTSFEGIL